MERILFIVTIAVLGITGWGLGTYIRKKVLEKKYLRIHLSKQEWLDDMDLIPIQENIDYEDNKESKKPPKPSHTPMDNSSFFSLVQKTRSKPRRPTHTIQHQQTPTSPNKHQKPPK